MAVRGAGVKRTPTKELATDKLPATLGPHSGWALIGTTAPEESNVSSKSALLYNFLSNQIIAYISNVQLQLHSKLANVGFKDNELNIFIFSYHLDWSISLNI